MDKALQLAAMDLEGGHAGQSGETLQSAVRRATDNSALLEDSVAPVEAGASPDRESHLAEPIEAVSEPERASIANATAIRRKRGPSLSRRIGQRGNVFQHGFTKEWDPAAPAYGRYWIDTPKRRKRQTVALGICTSRSVARRKLLEHIEREGINSKEAFTTTTAPATTFRAQAEKWIASLSTRRRKPVKPATIHGWRQSLNKWILPMLGDRLLTDISNGALRELVDQMAAAGLSAQSIVTHAKVVKMVVASAVNSDGEQIYPRKWNHDFIGLPIIRKEMQHRPTVTQVEVHEILAKAKKRYAMLFALLAGSGLRIGEALALKSDDLSHNCSIVRVRHSIWNGQEQQPKTPNAVREVDIAEPLARMLRCYVPASGYLFATQSGRPLGQRNVLRALHATGKKVGFHAFRRFRTETLRRARVPEDLIKLWLGHSKESITDFYASGLQKDEVWRREWCERVGLGYSVDGLLGLQSASPIDSEKVA
jgi:integrase